MINRTLLRFKPSALQDNVKKMGRQDTDWEKIFAKETSDNVLLSKYSKNS